MHEDPTRRMDVPPRGEPPQGGYGEPPPGDGGGGMSPGVKVAIGILVAAVIGLVAALAVVASDSGDDTSTTSSTTEPTTTSSTTTSSTTEPTTTSSTTTSTTTEPTTTTTATTTDRDDVDDDPDDVDGDRPRDDHRGRRDRSSLISGGAAGPWGPARSCRRVEDADLGQLREHGPALGGAVERVAGGEDEPLVADVVDDLDLVGLDDLVLLDRVGEGRRRASRA